MKNNRILGMAWNWFLFFLLFIASIIAYFFYEPFHDWILKTFFPSKLQTGTDGSGSKKAGGIGSVGLPKKGAGIPPLSSHSSSDGDLGKDAHNPFNLRQAHQGWQGEIGTMFSTHLPNDKVGFVNFDTFAHGCRAGLINMKHVIKGGANTVNKYIAKESPASDGNAPVPYAKEVASVMGISVTDVIDFSKKTEILAMAKAIELVELAGNFATSSDWDFGYSEALKH